MELPEDIIGYLCRFIKPKRYTLLSKFSRDFYFRKYGLSMYLDTYYPDTEICNKYRIKMIDSVKIPRSDLVNAVRNIKFGEKITRIICKDTIGSTRYKILRDSFQNLEKFKCIIIDSIDTDDIYPLEGTQLFINIPRNGWKAVPEDIEKRIISGYKIHCYLEDQSDVPQIIADNTVGVRIGYRIDGPINIARFPNLKILTIIHRIPLDYIIDEVLEHPTIKEIGYMINPKTHTIIKKNGKMVYINNDTWHIGCDTIPDQYMYENIKREYKYISLDTSNIIDKLMDYEMKSKIAKKMTIDMTLSGMDNSRILKILDLFNIKTCMENCRLRTWLKQAKSYKVKIIEQRVVYKLYVGNGKIRFISKI